ncbi:hypothetical protein ACU11_12945 [Xanthomonas oryzae pv. oryzicola]|nr:hypothetical protein ACU11_12945 [Xanthomonas oryzae pv. oryzicola]
MGVTERRINMEAVEALSQFVPSLPSALEQEKGGRGEPLRIAARILALRLTPGLSGSGLSKFGVPVLRAGGSINAIAISSPPVLGAATFAGTKPAIAASATSARASAKVLGSIDITDPGGS